MNRWYGILIGMTACFNHLLLSEERMPTSTEVSIREVMSEALSLEQQDTIRYKKVWFRYKDEPVANVINDLASSLGINIMLPQGPNALTIKLTFELPEKITLQRAWQYLITILNISGYSIIPSKTLSRVVKSDKTTIAKEPLPLYINVSPQDIPDTDLKIRYLKYLTNLQVPADSANPNNPLHSLLTDMLSSSGFVIYEPKLNGVLIIDSARNIKSASLIIDELDASLSVDEPVILKLKHTNANQIKGLFDQLAGSVASGANGTPINPGVSYFSADIRIIPELRSNSVIVLGKEEVVKRVVDFITKYIDVSLGQGRSVLHIYNLQYLKASDFAETLKAIISNQSSAGTQSTSKAGGDQYFKDVVIVPESAMGVSSAAKGSQAGNRLVIAARQSDWIRIEQLIQELDRPQPQVMIHGLVVDLSTSGLKELGAQMRNLKDFFIKDFNWQSAHLGNIENNTGSDTTGPTSPTALMSNLLPLPADSSQASDQNIASGATAGSFILSCTDPKTNGIWLIAQMLSVHEDTKILSQPFLTAMNNMEVHLRDAEQRIIAGDADARFGVTSSNTVTKDAFVDVLVTPRINSNNFINFNITVDIKEWVSANSQSQNTRMVKTNVNLKSGDILILGGLTKTKVTEEKADTPGLSSIPVLGHLFKSSGKTTTKSHLMIFLRPEIIYPENNIVTDTSLKKAANALSESSVNFGKLKDPITRLFFGSDPIETTVEGLSAFREEFEPLPLKRPKIEPKAPTISKVKKAEPAETKPTDSQTEEIKDFSEKHKDLDEETHAEDELKRLFGWENDAIQHKKRARSNDKATATPLSREIQTNTMNDEQEAEAEKELKKLLADHDKIMRNVRQSVSE